MYAIVRTGGKQYQVTSGDQVRVEKLQGDEDRRNYLDVLEAMNDRIAAYNNLRALRSKKMSRSRRPQHAR